MLIVIVIIGILAWVLLPKIWWARDKAQDVAVTANVKNLWTAIIQYQMDNKFYPNNISTEDDADNTKNGLNLFTNATLAEKYGLNISPAELTWGKYEYYTDSDKAHFIVCGQYSDNNFGWNGAKYESFPEDETAKTTIDLSDFDYSSPLESTWNWYCYQG